MKQAITTERVVCDDCGAEMNADLMMGVTSPSRFRTVTLTASKVSGADQVSKTADLCGECFDRISIPAVIGSVLAC